MKNNIKDFLIKYFLQRKEKSIVIDACLLLSFAQVLRQDYNVCIGTKHYHNDINVYNRKIDNKIDAKKRVNKYIAAIRNDEVLLKKSALRSIERRNREINMLKISIESLKSRKLKKGFRIEMCDDKLIEMCDDKLDSLNKELSDINKNFEFLDCNKKYRTSYIVHEPRSGKNFMEFDPAIWDLKKNKIKNLKSEIRREENFRNILVERTNVHRDSSIHCKREQIKFLKSCIIDFYKLMDDSLRVDLFLKNIAKLESKLSHKKQKLSVFEQKFTKSNAEMC
jgi:hypothetical protein